MAGSNKWRKPHLIAIPFCSAVAHVRNRRTGRLRPPLVTSTAIV